MFEVYNMNQEIKEALDQWAKSGKPVGQFLQAVLSNDLMGTIGRASQESQRDLVAICSYVYWELPAACHGSVEKMIAWQASFKKE